MKTDPSSSRPGFTLIELLVVIAVIGILAAILVPTANKAMDTAKRTACLSNIRQIASTLQSHTYDNKRRFVGTDITPRTRPLDLANFGGQEGNNGKWIGRMQAQDRPLVDLLPTFDVFRCPSDIGDNALRKGERAFDEVGTSYLYPITSEAENADVASLYDANASNKQGMLLSRITATSKKVIVFEPSLFQFQPNSREARYDSAMWHTEECASVLGFADGHADFVIRTENAPTIQLNDGLTENEKDEIKRRSFY